MSDQQMKRRDFMESFAYTGIGSIGCIAFVSLLASCSNNSPTSSNTSQQTGKKLTLKISENTELQQIGGFKTILLGSTPAIVFRIDETTFKALSRVCTHQGCTVNWQSANNRFECPCHLSRFNNSGQVINGPATRPLQSFTTQYDSNTDQVTILY